MIVCLPFDCSFSSSTPKNISFLLDFSFCFPSPPPKKKKLFAFFFFVFDLNFFGRVELAIPLRLLKLEGQGRVLSRDPADDASTADRGNYSSTQRPAFSCQRARRAGE